MTVTSTPLLQGTRVVEFSQLIAAPFCGLTLADLGADVVKVEPPGGDVSRGFPPQIDGAGAFFHALNRGKRGVTIDLGQRDGQARAAELIAGADVVIENMGPASGALGTSYADAVAGNPRLVWCSISATGHGRSDRAVDGSVQAEWGVMGVTGEFGGPPVRAGVSLIDYMTGMYAIQRVLSALWAVERGHPGCFIDCAMMDAAATLTSMQALLGAAGVLEPPRAGSESHLRVPTGAFQAADRSYVQVTCVTESHWRALCRALDRTDWIADSRFSTLAQRMTQRETMRALVAEVIATGTAQHWVSAIRAHGGLCDPIRDIAEVWRDPRIAERGLAGRIVGDASGIAVPVVSLVGTAPVDALPHGPALRP